MQTFKSEWGRRSITVSDECPTLAIRLRLSNTHVGTPMKAVIAMIRGGIEKSALRDQRWTDEYAAEAVRFARWQHNENRAEYAAVMGGRIGG